MKKNINIEEDFAQDARETQEELSFQIAQGGLPSKYKPGESLNFKASSIILNQSTAPRREGEEKTLFSFFDVEGDEEAQRELSSRSYKGISISTDQELRFLLYLYKEINNIFLQTKEQQETFRNSSDYLSGDLQEANIVLHIVVKDFFRDSNNYSEEDIAKLGGKQFQDFEKMLDSLEKKTQYFVIEDTRGREYSLECKLFTTNNKIRAKVRAKKSEDKSSDTQRRLLSFDLIPNRLIFRGILEKFTLFPNDIIKRLADAKAPRSELFTCLFRRCMSMRGACIKKKVPYREKLSTLFSRLEKPSSYYKNAAKKQVSYTKLKKGILSVFEALKQINLLKSYKITTAKDGEQQFEVYFSETFINKDERPKKELSSGKEEEQRENSEETAKEIQQ